MSRLRLGAALVGVAAAAAVLGGAAWGIALYRTVHRPYSGWRGESVVIDIPADWSARQVVSRLESAGVLADARAARGWLTWTGGERRLRAGEYRFDAPATLREVLERIERGDVLLHRVTVPEGLRLEQTARIVSAAGFGSVAEVERAFRDPAPIRDLDPNAVDLEGYLFPETYWFPKTETAGAIAAAMVRAFRASAGPDFAERSRRRGLSAREAVVLASLIEEETSVPAERPRISRVFHNRLARRMPMQCDPTVLYALHRAGREVEQLTRADLAFASPWNSYRNVGLPPGPICSPGAESLRAALAPADGNELYFVASPSGGHQFSPDLKSHERAVRVWRAYLRSSR